MGFNVTAEQVGQYYQDVFGEEEPNLEQIDFEAFARIVAVVLEDVNKITEANPEDAGEAIEESFNPSQQG